MIVFSKIEGKSVNSKGNDDWMGALKGVKRFETLQRIRKRADLRNVQVLPGNIEDSDELKQQ